MTAQPSLMLPDPMDSSPYPDETHQLGAQDRDELVDMDEALILLAGGPKLTCGVTVPGWRLYIVLDTNVLLSRSTLRVLEQLSKRSGPGCGGNGPIEVVAIIPWTVLMELDGLKTRSDGKGEPCAVAMM